MNDENLFHRALDLPAGERASFLSAACGGNEALRRRVEQLLQAHAEPGSFMAAPPAAATDAYPPFAHATGMSGIEALGTQIGPYKLLKQIGEGGMGTVFMAEQTHPVQRQVALKVIKAGMDSAQVIARFEAERQALAVMDHVNIARVLDAGATPPSPPSHGGAWGGGRPYFVMELVHGVPITKYCDDNHLTPRQRLELFVPVCHAIQHAHQKGIIHRDIKPSNVLITLYDGKPIPKVIDFGVAKAIEQRLTERTLFTQFGTMVGTFEYMSPEQAEMSAQGADTRSDIFSLGVLLYELLTGSTPLSHKRLKEAAFAEVLRMIKEEEPPKPSTRLSDSGEALASISAQRHMEPAKLAKLMRGELDWIVMKCLEKDRNHRYETANGFAADVQRYLNDEPVLACPPSAVYRLRKFVRRNKGPVLAASVFALLLVGGIIGTTWQAMRATQAERLAKDNEQDALAQKDKAQTNFALAKDAVDKYLNTVTDHPKLNEKDFYRLRKELLETAVPFYQKFVDERSDDPEMEAARGRAYLRLAHVRNAMGEKEAARSDYEAMRAIFAKLSDDFPSVAEYRQDLAMSHNNLGNLLITQGQHREAELAFSVALKLQEQLATDFPGVPVFRQELARSHNNFGVLLRGLGQRGEAESAHRAALKMRAHLATEFPEKAMYRKDLARSHLNLGLLLSDLGKGEESESAQRTALKIQEQLAADLPNVPAYRQDLAMSQNNLGNFLAGVGQREEAEATHRAALKIRAQLAAEFPGVPLYRQDLAQSHNNLGALLKNLEKREEAESAHRAALKLQEQLDTEFPGVPAYRQELARSHNNLALLLQAMERHGEAEAAHRAALKIKAQLAVDFPGMPAYRQDLARSQHNLAILLNNLGQREEAEAAHRAAVTIKEQLAADFSGVPAYAVELANSYKNLGILVREKGESQAALGWFAKAIGTLEPVVKKEPRLVIGRQYLHHTHVNRAETLDVLHRHGEAVQDWDRAIQLADGPNQAKLQDSKRRSLILSALKQDSAWQLFWGWPKF